MSSPPPPGSTRRDTPAEDALELYEDAPCGLLSARPDGTILRANRTLHALLGFAPGALTGRRLSDLLTAGGRIYHETHYAPLLALQGAAREIALDLVRVDGTRVPVLLTSAVVAQDGRQPVVRTSVFPATERRAYEQELVRERQRAERSETRARELATALQATFVPPSPPAIPGLDVGAAYRPAGDGSEVGGDFYDIFEAAHGDWAVVLGDVCGKGAAAAAVTALARHTVRAAALRTRRPSAVLADLNAVLLRNGVDRFCTAVYLRLVPRPDGSVTVTVASGGHPLPLRAGPEGLSAVGRPGSLIGVLEDVELHDTTVRLEPDETLFAFTDGLVEGRRGSEFYGEDRLGAALLAQSGRGAGEAAQALVDDVVAFQGGAARDDMAAVLLRVGRRSGRA